MKIRVVALLLLAGLSLLSIPGCSKQSRVERHLASADKYLQAGRYAEAEIEYKNALQQDPNNARAMGRLGTIFLDQGRPLSARGMLARAVELAPDDTAFQLKLALTDIAVRDFAGAHAKASTVLNRDPRHRDAPRILAEAAIGLGQTAEAKARLTSLPPDIVDSAPVQFALGQLAVSAADLDAAEKSFRRVLALEPDSADAYAAIGGILLTRRDVAGGEAALKRAAELAPPRSPRRLQYAQLKLHGGDPAAARAYLEQLTREAPDFIPAWLLLAQIASGDRKFEEALGHVNKVLARDPLHPEAILLSARLQVALGDPAAAVSALERALGIFPGAPQFHHELATSAAAAGDLSKALENANAALRSQPEYPDAAVLRASLLLRTGDISASIAALRGLVEKYPRALQPRLLLADAYRANRNLPEALGVYESIDRDFPADARVPLFQGLTLLQMNRPAEARAAFERSLARTPDYLPAIEQLVILDTRERAFAAAEARIAALRGKMPQAPEPLIVLSRVLMAQQRTAEAEATLEQAIQLRPEAPNAYFLLASLHASARQEERALARLQPILERNPNDIRALSLSALLLDQLKRYDEALAMYERLRAVNPNSGIALNNLAYLYSERFNDPTKALEAARRARSVLPNDPRVADTLGWILVRRGEYPHAITLLRESADRLTDSAEVHYHLGVAHYSLGEEELARIALEKALQLGEFPGLEDARNRLAVLAIDPARAGSADQTRLDAALAARADDPVALARLGAIQERRNEPARAIATFEAALKSSPANVRVMVDLIRLHERQGNSDKAFELAQNARKLAPESVPVAQALGRLAFARRDYPWAYSLTQEVARRDPDNPAGARAFARAALQVGRIEEAESALQRLARLDAFGPESTKDRQLAELIALGRDPARAAAASEAIQRALETDPNQVAAHFASARASEARQDWPAAIAALEKVLELAPDFTPAMARLVVISARAGRGDPRLSELALKARPLFPNDAELAKAFGIVLFRQGEFSRALPLLRESASRLGNDAELAYYLGLTHHRLNETAAARQQLQRALDLRLPADLTAEARKTLAELP